MNSSVLTSLDLPSQKRDISPNKSIVSVLTVSEIDSLRQDKRNAVAEGRAYLASMPKKI